MKTAQARERDESVIESNNKRETEEVCEARDVCGILSEGTHKKHHRTWPTWTVPHAQCTSCRKSAQLTWPTQICPASTMCIVHKNSASDPYKVQHARYNKVQPIFRCTLSMEIFIATVHCGKVYFSFFVFFKRIKTTLLLLSVWKQ